MKNLKKLLMLLMLLSGGAVSAMDIDDFVPRASGSGSGSSSIPEKGEQPLAALSGKLSSMIEMMKNAPRHEGAAQDREDLDEESLEGDERPFEDPEAERNRIDEREAEYARRLQELDTRLRCFNAVRQEFEAQQKALRDQETELRRQQDELAAALAKTDAERKAEAEEKIAHLMQQGIAKLVQKNPRHYGVSRRRKGSVSLKTTRRGIKVGMRPEVVTVADLGDVRFAVDFMARLGGMAEILRMVEQDIDEATGSKIANFVLQSMPYLTEIDFTGSTVPNRTLFTIISTIASRPVVGAVLSAVKSDFRAMKKLVLDGVEGVATGDVFEKLLAAILNMPNLEEISLNGCNLTLAQCISLIEKIATHPKIATVKLDENCLTQGDAYQLVGAVHRLLVRVNDRAVTVSIVNDPEIDWANAIAHEEVSNAGCTTPLRAALGLQPLAQQIELQVEPQREQMPVDDEE